MNDLNQSKKQAINGDLNKINNTSKSKKNNERSNSISSSSSNQKLDMTKPNASNKCYIKLLDSNNLKNNQQLIPMNGKNSMMTHKNTNNSKTTCRSNDELNLSVDELIRILNIFAFFVFLTFVICLNLVGLFILPYFVKTSLTLND